MGTWYKKGTGDLEEKKVDYDTNRTQSVSVWGEIEKQIGDESVPTIIGTPSGVFRKIATWQGTSRSHEASHMLSRNRLPSRDHLPSPNRLR